MRQRLSVNTWQVMPKLNNQIDNGIYMDSLFAIDCGNLVSDRLQEPWEFVTGYGPRAQI